MAARLERDHHPGPSPAEIINLGVGLFPGSQLRVHCLWRTLHEFSYLHPERYNGTTGHDRWPEAKAFWERMDPLEKEGNEGESFTELLARVEAMEEQLRQASEEFIAIFSHGLFLRAFLWMALTGFRDATKRSMEKYLFFSRGISMPNGSILKTRFEPDGRLFFAPFDTAHLPEALGLVDE